MICQRAQPWRHHPVAWPHHPTPPHPCHVTPRGSNVPPRRLLACGLRPCPWPGPTPAPAAPAGSAPVPACAAPRRASRCPCTARHGTPRHGSVAARHMDTSANNSVVFCAKHRRRTEACSEQETAAWFWAVQVNPNPPANPTHRDTATTLTRTDHAGGAATCSSSPRHGTLPSLGPSACGWSHRCHTHCHHTPPASGPDHSRAVLGPGIVALAVERRGVHAVKEDIQKRLQ